MQTEHLIIRQLGLYDINDFFEIVSDDRVKDDMTPVKSKSDAFDFIQKALLDPRHFLFAFVLKGKVIGVVSLKISEDKIGKLAMVMNPNFWNKGYGSEGMLAIEKFTLEKMKLCKLQAECNLFNSSCTQLFRSVLDFDYIKTEQIDGADVLFFEKTREKHFNIKK